MAYELRNFEAGQVLTAEALNIMDNQIKSNEESLSGKQDSGDYVTQDELTTALEGKQDSGDYVTQTALEEALALLEERIAALEETATE